MKMKHKRYAVSDIHGNHKLLKQVLKESKFNYEKDELIVVGDVCDGYNESYEVVEELLKIKNMTFIIGNHDRWFINHIANGWAEDIWLSQGGEATRKSYEHNGHNYKKMPTSHKKFFNNGRYYYELDNMLFVHGGFNYPKHPSECSVEDLTWDRSLIERCKNGLEIRGWDKVFVGHTTTESQGAEPVSYGVEGCAKFIQIDCGAGWGGRLCLYNIDTDECFLSDYAERHEVLG